MLTDSVTPDRPDGREIPPPPAIISLQMKIYLKWSLLVFGPFLLIVAGVAWWMTRNPDNYSREELDKSYNKEQVQRLLLERAEKKYLDEQFQRAQKPKTGPGQGQ